jgi:hypothetical protein
MLARRPVTLLVTFGECDQIARGRVPLRVRRFARSACRFLAREEVLDGRALARPRRGAAREARPVARRRPV